MYTGIKNWENGHNEEKQFENYDDLCDWLAESPEAGIAAYTEVGTVDQGELGEDVLARQ